MYVNDNDEKRSAKCMYLTICSCLPPTRLAIPPSSAPQLTLNLILDDDDDDDGDDGDDDDIETNIVVTIFLIPNIAVSVHTGVDSVRQSSQAGAGEVLYTQVDVQPPFHPLTSTIGPCCLQAIPCFLCPCKLSRVPKGNSWQRGKKAAL